MEQEFNLKMESFKNEKYGQNNCTEIILLLNEIMNEKNNKFKYLFESMKYYENIIERSEPKRDKDILSIIKTIMSDPVEYSTDIDIGDYIIYYHPHGFVNFGIYKIRESNEHFYFTDTIKGKEKKKFKKYNTLYEDYHKLDNCYFKDDDDIYRNFDFYAWEGIL